MKEDDKLERVMIIIKYGCTKNAKILYMDIVYCFHMHT